MNNAKISTIVQQVATSLDIKLHEKENTASDLRFESKIRGVDVYLFFSMQTKDKSKVQAYFSVGSGRNYEPDFFKKITFNDSKAENAIFKDLIQRLEVDKINEKIDTIEDNLFRGSFSGRKNGTYFELSQNKDRLHINTKDKDILLRICAAAAQILEEEAARATNSI